MNKPEEKKCEHGVVAKYCFRCKRPDLAGNPKDKKVDNTRLGFKEIHEAPSQPLETSWELKLIVEWKLHNGEKEPPRWLNDLILSAQAEARTEFLRDMLKKYLPEHIDKRYPKGQVNRGSATTEICMFLFEYAKIREINLEDKA